MIVDGAADPELDYDCYNYYSDDDDPNGDDYDDDQQLKRRFQVYLNLISKLTSKNYLRWLTRLMERLFHQRQGLRSVHDSSWYYSSYDASYDRDCYDYFPYPNYSVQFMSSVKCHECHHRFGDVSMLSATNNQTRPTRKDETRQRLVLINYNFKDIV